jgi:hypothetical protein
MSEVTDDTAFEKIRGSDCVNIWKKIYRRFLVIHGEEVATLKGWKKDFC